jgi:hypothetical protein
VIHLVTIIPAETVPKIRKDGEQNEIATCFVLNRFGLWNVIKYVLIRFDPEEVKHRDCRASKAVR